ncbi:type II secretion system F family protein [Pseudogulbenkiania ferrooxidans]|uniref:Type II secretion system protein n=1 Tax=Pseudogulbenkiania ferrooxidans 2002 TaxID=279714 RepID=B9YZT1_9NEIS|nr:type II secretion system F family protein [Pseudogulbenkiania ferrooxidans]EEG09814.1 type II secretion system protein [Pseudogulbenkiania ferrooxidans 2002]
MNTSQWIYLGIIFVAVFGVALTISMQIAPNRVKARLDKISETETPIDSDSASAWVAKAVKIATPLAKLSVPAEGWETSPIRIRFMNAGYRGQSAVPLFFGAKTFLALLFPTILFLYLGLTGGHKDGTNFLLFMLLAAGIGYYLPNILLSRRVENRQREIFNNFPDAIDLLLVCVEAGLGLDAALLKVGEEMRIKSPILADELHLVNLELRAGSTKERALRNLAIRTGVQEVDTLVAMLIQSDRFGTSIGESLRVHADDLRTKRRLRAEEAAAKIPLKLLFPLIFCIFPALLLVLLGPAFIQIYRVLLPTLGGGH